MIYNIVGPTLPDTFAIAVDLVNAALKKDYEMEVGPFEPEIMARVYVFVSGKMDEVNEVIEEVKKKRKMVVTPVLLSRVRDFNG